jgi:hypothetical protein
MAENSRRGHEGEDGSADVGSDLPETEPCREDRVLPLTVEVSR